MNNKLKLIGSSGAIIALLISSMFYMTFLEYKNTYAEEAKIEHSAENAQKQLVASVYKEIKSETQTKTDKVAEEVRASLVEHYEGRQSQFEKDYDEPIVDAFLPNEVDRIINSKEHRFFRIENDSNDMFAMTSKGILADMSEDCSVFGPARKFEDEISMHFNKELAEQALGAISGGNTKDVFWRFSNSDKTSKDKGIQVMDIDKVLDLPLEEIKDYEFLTVSYIDEDADIFGKRVVAANGTKQNAKRIAIVQGFSLYDQIEDMHEGQILKLERDKKVKLSSLEEKRNSLKIELALTVFITVISFVSVAMIYNSYLMGYKKSGPDTR